MANGFLQLIIGSSGTYEDGDIKSATNHRSCRSDAAWAVCKKLDSNRKFEFRNLSTGFMNRDTVAQDFEESIHEYKFVRLDSITAKKVRLSDMAEVEFESNVPFADPFDNNRIVAMDIKIQFQQMASALLGNLSTGKMMFGTGVMDCEYYSGKYDPSHANLDILWSIIERKTGILEVNTVQPAVFSNYKKFLTIKVDDFDDETSGDLVSPLMDNTDLENPVQIKKRQRHIIWRDLAGIVERDVTDRRTEVRLDKVRDYVRSIIVQTRTR